MVGEDEGVIYALCDPDTLEIRYVGQTRVSTERRLKQHIYAASRGKPFRSSKWIRSLVASGRRPVLQVLEIVNKTELDTAETAWIKDLRTLEARLTNLTDGGTGNTGSQWSPEQRRVITEKAKLRCVDPVERARMSAISNGKPPIRFGSDNNKAKLTDEKVVWLRQQVKAGRSYGEIAADLAVTPQAVWFAATGRTWKAVAETPVVSAPRSRYSAGDYQAIRNSVSAGKSQTAVALEFGASPSYVSNIVTGKRGLSSLSTKEVTE
jgi:hypothetical protein